jgi:hypothetical protein
MKSKRYVGQVKYEYDYYSNESTFKCGILDTVNDINDSCSHSHYHRILFFAKICAKNWARSANREAKKLAKPYKPSRKERKIDKYREWNRA